MHYIKCCVTLYKLILAKMVEFIERCPTPGIAQPQQQGPCRGRGAGGAGVGAGVGAEVGAGGVEEAQSSTKD